MFLCCSKTDTIPDSGLCSPVIQEEQDVQFFRGGGVYVVMQICLHAQPQHKILQSHVPGGELHKRTQQVRITQQLTSNCISKSGCSKAPDCFTYIKVELWFTKCPVVLTKTSQTLRVFWNTQDTQTATDK